MSKTGSTKTTINLTFTLFGEGGFEARTEYVETFTHSSEVQARIAELKKAHGKNVQGIRRFSGGRRPSTLDHMRWCWPPSLEELKEMSNESDKVILGACEEIDEAVGELRGLVPDEELDEIAKATHGIRRALCETIVLVDSLPPPSPYAFFTPRPGEFSG